MCTRPDDVSNLDAVTEPSAGGWRTSVGGIYSRVLRCRVLSSSAMLGIDGDRSVGLNSVCGAAAGAHESRGSSGERRRRHPVCKR